MARYWPQAGVGARHNAALVLGGFLSRAGVGNAQIKLAAEAVARAVEDPEWKDRRKAAEDAAAAHQAGKKACGLTSLREMFGKEVADRIAEWLDYSGGDEAQPEDAGEKSEQLLPLPYINMSNWDGEPIPEQEWGVFDQFPLCQTAVFSGEGAGGKSTLALHSASRTFWAVIGSGSMPELGPAIVIDAEDDNKVMHRRLANIRDHYRATSINPDEEISFKRLIKDGLHLVSLVNEDATLAAASRSGKIEPTALYKRLLKDAGEIRPRLISIASSANVCAGTRSTGPGPTVRQPADQARHRGKWLRDLDRAPQPHRHHQRYWVVRNYPMAQRGACEMLPQERQA